MATREKGRAPASGRRRRPPLPRGRRRLRLVWLVAIVGLAVYLYYRPLATYVETRRDLTARQAEVETLRIVRADLERRLESATSLEATQREARRIGYVRPGERLYVVKGIPDWRRAQRTVRGDG